ARPTAASTPFPYTPLFRSALRDQKALEAVARHEGQGGLERIQTAERGKLVQHQQQPMPLAGGGQFLRQPPADLVEDQADERLGRSEEHTSELQSRENLVCR